MKNSKIKKNQNKGNFRFSKRTQRQRSFTLIELLVVIAVIGIVVSIVLVNSTQTRNMARQTKVEDDLLQIQDIIDIARHKQDKVLIQITGSGCSDCPCRDDADLKNPDSACLDSMTNAFQKIGAPLVKDPWGSPYLIDENELEFGGNPCRQDTFRSAGPDRKYGTGDDITRDMPFYSPQCL